MRIFSTLRRSVPYFKKCDKHQKKSINLFSALLSLGEKFYTKSYTNKNKYKPNFALPFILECLKYILPCCKDIKMTKHTKLYVMSRRSFSNGIQNPFSKLLPVRNNVSAALSCGLKQNLATFPHSEWFHGKFTWQTQCNLQATEDKRYHPAHKVHLDRPPY
jgi:hypothetical protein